MRTRHLVIEKKMCYHQYSFHMNKLEHPSVDQNYKEKKVKVTSVLSYLSYLSTHITNQATASHSLPYVSHIDTVVVEQCDLMTCVTLDQLS